LSNRYQVFFLPLGYLQSRQENVLLFGRRKEMKRNRFFILMLIGVVLVSGCAVATPAEESSASQEAYHPRPTSPPAYEPEYQPEYVPSHRPYNPSDENPYPDTFFQNYGVNPRIDSEDDHYATFGLDVDTGSYTLMRGYINDRNLPPADSVRVEEYVNFFEQDYPNPWGDLFGIYLEGAPMPYDTQGYYLLRVGLQAQEIPEEERDKVVLTFLIDTSGSMSSNNRLKMVQHALEMLVRQLDPRDEIGIVAYNNSARVVLEHTQVRNERAILSAIRRLRPTGSTNAEDGLITAYRLASEYFDPWATNRVILCSDGVANVGATGPNSILRQVARYADEDGIYLTTIGVGMGNYNDVLLEQLADDGQGFYAYVDSRDEAERVFVEDLVSTLQVVAKDARVQVDFNPDVVSRYRLIGYENRDMADEDFRNEEIDAGEIGAGHSVTALFEIKFEDDARFDDLVATVHLRFEDPIYGVEDELSAAISRGAFERSFEDASYRFQLDALVAEFAEIMRNSYWARKVYIEDIAWDIEYIADQLAHDEDVQEFAELVYRAMDLIDREN
jgi:Ca-activated chloride channel family protein